MVLRKQKVAKVIRSGMETSGAATQGQYASWLRSRGINVSQPTISRLIRGDYLKAPRSLRAICGYSSIAMNRLAIRADPKTSSRLMKALQDTWDGTPEHEAFLSQVIKAAGRLGRIVAAKNKVSATRPE